MSFALRPEVKVRLEEFRRDGGSINVSKVCNDGILAELNHGDRKGRVAQRLRIELTSRRGPAWVQGRAEGRRWAEDEASWVEITGNATRWGEKDVAVKDSYRSGTLVLVFAGAFRAPKDYLQNGIDTGGAPAFQWITVAGAGDAGAGAWEFSPVRCTAYWRGWLAGVREVYEELRAELPDVSNEVPTAMEPESDVVGVAETPFAKSQRVPEEISS